MSRSDTCCRCFHWLVVLVSLHQTESKGKQASPQKHLLTPYEDTKRYECLLQKLVSLLSTLVSVLIFLISSRHTLPTTQASPLCTPPRPCPQPEIRAADLATHAHKHTHAATYGTAGTKLHAVIRGMVPDTWLCCGAG